MQCLFTFLLQIICFDCFSLSTVRCSLQSRCCLVKKNTKFLRQQEAFHRVPARQEVEREAERRRLRRTASTATRRVPDVTHRHDWPRRNDLNGRRADGRRGPRHELSPRTRTTSRMLSIEAPTQSESIWPTLDCYNFRRGARCEAAGD